MIPRHRDPGSSVRSRRKKQLSLAALLVGFGLPVLSEPRNVSANSGQWDGNVQMGDTYETGDNWLYIYTDFGTYYYYANPSAGDDLTIYNGQANFEPASAGTNLVLSNSSSDGQSMTLDGNSYSAGLNVEYGMEVDDGGSLNVFGDYEHGYLTIGNTLAIGESAGQSTTVTFQAGSSVVVGTTSGTQDRSFYDGTFGFGTVNQSGGYLQCATNLILGDEPGSQGNYNLSGLTSASSLIQVGGTTCLGGNTSSSGGTGLFNMSGGILETGAMKIWDVAGTEFNLSGGVLEVETGPLDTSGNASLFNWTGGELDLLSEANEVSLDANGLLGPTINIGSTQKLQTAFTVYVGNDGPAAMTISGGGTFVSNAGGGSVIVTNVAGANGSSVTIDGAGSSWAVNGSGNMRIGAYATGTLTVRNGGSFSSQIAVGLGYNNISGVGTGNGIVNVQSGGTFTASNGLYIGGSPSGSAGTGTFNLSGGTANVTGTTEIWNGQSSLNVTGGVFSSGTLVDLGAYYQNAGTATFGAIRGTGQMTITGGLTTLATGGGESDIGALTLSGTGTLDITNNHLFINYGSGPDPVASIAGYIKSGYNVQPNNGGAWNGPGIISSAARTPTNFSFYGVGYADGADGVVAGLTSGQIEVMYTLLGDANLDGLVNGSDFNILAANFNQSITGWDQGDFNYDGLVNAADFNELAANFNQGVSGADVSAGDVAALDAFALANGLPLPSFGNVPEPSSMGLLTLAGLGMLNRRRRRAGKSRVWS
jgi:T5SS/PEP-CTERM-associated repeat protein